MAAPKRRLVLHPYLFALYAVMALFANNVSQIGLAGIRALLFSVIGVVIVVILARLVLRDAVKAGLISSGVILLAFSYGHVETLVGTWRVGDFQVGQPALLAPIWVALFLLWAYLVLRRWKNLGVISDYLNWVSLILNVFPIYTLLVFNNQSAKAQEWVQAYVEEAWREGDVARVGSVARMDIAGAAPDIYYIILDAYARTDVLQALYDYDNRAFIEFLEQRGFYVAGASNANYTDTELSLAASLNMIHISGAPEFFRENAGSGSESMVSSAATELIRQNRVADILRAQGYTFVAFDSGYPIARASGADQFLGPPEAGDENFVEAMFDMMLLDTTLGRLFFNLRGDEFAPLQSLFDAHRSRIRYTLMTMPEFAEKEGDFFIFAHVMCPHPPFVFGPNGEELKRSDPYTLLDGDPPTEENITLYRDQVRYVSQLTMQAIDRILASSDTPPIIIIQGDHGSKAYREADPPVDVQMMLLFPILNAYYLPANGDAGLYDSISPVNSFRVILNQYLGTELDLLEDKGYVLEVDQGEAQFVDVCSEYAYCSPSP